MILPSLHFWSVGENARIYSSSAQGFVPTDDPAYVAFRARGERPTRVGDMAEVATFLRRFNIPPYHTVAKRTIVGRLQSAGLLTAARAALDAADLFTRERWNAREAIFADDPTAIALLQNIGADPASILSPRVEETSK